MEMSQERPSSSSRQGMSATPHPSPGRGKLAKRQRYMQRNGQSAIPIHHASGEWGHYVTDIFTTLVEVRWRLMLLIFSLAYILSWLIFGLSYWLIAYVNGDLGETPNEMPCVYQVHSFTAAFLFSMETQATIGYGFRGMSENCMVAIVVVTAQDVLSCFIDTAIIGVVIAKMACARKRARTVGFSKCAVINLQNGALCLQWRIGDFRGNHILEGEAQGQVVRHRLLPTGEVSLSHQDLKLQCRAVALATPVTVTHELDQHSPLYALSPQALEQEEEAEYFELVVSFTYTDDSAGMVRQTRASYGPGDIRWSQRFQDPLRLGKRHYHADYSFFHQTTWVQVPQMSAQDWSRSQGQMDGTKPCRATIPRRAQIRRRSSSVNLVLEEAWL